MNNKIVIYLFVFTALVLIFQLVNSKKILDDQKDRLIKLKENNSNYEKIILKLQTELDEVINFSLKNNEYALSYFNDIKIENPTNLIEDQLYEKNLIKQKDNPIHRKKSNIFDKQNKGIKSQVAYC